MVARREEYFGKEDEDADAQGGEGDLGEHADERADDQKARDFAFSYGARGREEGLYVESFDHAFAEECDDHADVGETEVLPVAPPADEAEDNEDHGEDGQDDGGDHHPGFIIRVP